MIVVDASVVVSALTDPGPRGSSVQRRMDSDDVLAPDLVDLEVLSALRRRVRLGEIAEVDARRALSTLARSPIERVPVVPLLSRVWALRDNLTANDASYVALAEGLEVPLLTRDARLAHAPGIRCVIELIS